MTNNEKRSNLRPQIFIPIPWFLPAFRAGGPIRSVANLVKYYKDADFWIFTGDSDVNGERLTGIETGRWTDYNEHTKIWYAPKERISFQITRQCELIKPEVIFCIGMYSWHFTMVPLIYCSAPHKIVSVRGMLHPGALSKKAWKKKIFLQLFKWMGFPKRISFHATDEDEKEHILKQMGLSVKVFVAGNIPLQLTPLAIPHKSVGELRLVTLSLISPMKNILAILKALHLVTSKVRYEIYGAIKDPEYWKQCENEIETLPENIQVIYKETIPFNETEKALSENHVFIMPSVSENFGHSIYEALSSGRPAITSINTPWKNLKEHKAGINVDPEVVSEISDAIDFFGRMNDQSLNNWATSSVRFAKAAIDLEKTVEAYREMFNG